MPDRAQVASIEAIETFRASLIVFVTKARALLEEIDDEKRRLKVWVQEDRRVYWERECARRNRSLQAAQQELLSARISSFQSHTAAQLLAVERAKQALRQAEAKRDVVKKWSREFDHRVEPLSKEVQLLHAFLSSDLTKAQTHLVEILKLLDAYVGTRLQAPATATAPSATESSGAEPVSARAEPGAASEPSPPGLGGTG